MKNWVTSIFGFLFVVASAVAKTTHGSLQTIAETISIAAGGLGLHAAKDKSNTTPAK